MSRILSQHVFVQHGFVLIFKYLFAFFLFLFCCISFIVLFVCLEYNQKPHAIASSPLPASKNSSQMLPEKKSKSPSKKQQALIAHFDEQAHEATTTNGHQKIEPVHNDDDTSDNKSAPPPTNVDANNNATTTTTPVTINNGVNKAPSIAVEAQHQVLLNCADSKYAVYVDDYFKRVEAEVEQEREANKQRLDRYYDSLLADLREARAKFYSSLNEATSNDLSGEFQTLSDNLRDYRLRFSELNTSLDAKVLSQLSVEPSDVDNDELQRKWRILDENVKRLELDLREKYLADYSVQFKAFDLDLELRRIEELCGSLDYAHTIDSRILTPRNKRDLKKLCGFDTAGKQQKYALIYRASRDGFAAADFHAKCDGKANTLTLIKTTSGYIFGGYTACAWHPKNGYQKDPKAFIFSLVNKSKTPLLIRGKSDHENVCSHKDYGPTFGRSSGCDICIFSNSNENDDNFSKLGSAFDFKLHDHGSNEAKCFLAGTATFRTSDIEVFQIS